MGPIWAICGKTSPDADIGPCGHPDLFRGGHPDLKQVRMAARAYYKSGWPPTLWFVRTVHATVHPSTWHVPRRPSVSPRATADVGRRAGAPAGRSARAAHTGSRFYRPERPADGHGPGWAGTRARRFLGNVLASGPFLLSVLGNVLAG